MRRILVEYERMIPTVELTLKTIQGFCHKFNCFLVIKRTNQITSQDIKDCDVVISIRGDSSLSKRIAKYARKNGRKFILMIDDDLLHLPISNLRFSMRKKQLRQIISLSDIVYTDNILLAKEYAEMSSGKRYAIVKGEVNSNEIIEFDRNGNQEEKVRIIYAAGEKHVKLFNKYILPVMPMLREKYKKKVSFTFIGVRPDLTEFEEDMDIRYIKSMPFEEYRKFMKSNRFDIGLAPLEEDHFHKRKYFNKYLEYAMHGICGLYSKSEPYIFAVDNEINGLLCENNREAWEQAFCRLIEDRQLRNKCIINSQNNLREVFTSEKIYRSMYEEMPELTNHSAPNKVSGSTFWYAKCEYVVFRLMESLYLTAYTLKREGLSGTLHKIGRKLKR